MPALRRFQLREKAEDRKQKKGGETMGRLELFNQIAKVLWDNEMIDLDNYNYDFES